MLTAIHAWFGLHVLARGVVFVDLSLAQVAALGLTVAILAGHDVQSEAGYWYALAFALGGALLFALTRAFEARIQQEAIIGIVYAVSASLGVLALDRAPQGAEHIKQLLIGSILTVTPQEVAHDRGALRGDRAFCTRSFRRAIVEVSFEPRAAAARGRRLLLWDVVFYGSFALVVTSSVRIAGVLLVFAYLIVPAALAGSLAAGLARRLVVAWALGAALTAAGLYASWHWDLPTGPAIVSAFGAAVGARRHRFRCAQARAARRCGQIAAGAHRARRARCCSRFRGWTSRGSMRWRRSRRRCRRIFLTDSERSTRSETMNDIERARAELDRLRALEQDVRWGKADMEAEKAERLRQYLAGRSEIAAGDQLVLRSLRARARERQRWMLGAAAARDRRRRLRCARTRPSRRIAIFRIDSPRC